MSAPDENLGFDTTKLVWTEEQRINYLKWASKMFLMPDEPLLPIKVDAASEITVSEDIEYDGILKRFMIGFSPFHSGLVKVQPYLSGRLLIIGGGIAGDDQTFEFKESIEFSKGAVAKVVIKNFDRYDHIVGVRFFTLKKAEG